MRWKSVHARVVQRKIKLRAELDPAKAEIRQLKDERFGKKSEKQSRVDRTNHLKDPQQRQEAPKKKCGRQPGSLAPKRRDYSHLPARIQEVDVSDDAKVCPCCGLPLEGRGQNDDCEQIEIETVYRRVVRRKRYRRTCACPDPPRTVTAPFPTQLLVAVAVRKQRLSRVSAVRRKNSYGSGSEWSGRVAMRCFRSLRH